MLEKHGRRLTSLERGPTGKAWRSGRSPAGASAEARVESAVRGAPILALIDLRRRLYGASSRSQKAGLVRRGGPIFVPVQAQFAGPIGPYNDRQNLEGVLNLLAQGDPAWVEEFLELYRGLAGLKAMLPAGPGNKA